MSKLTHGFAPVIAFLIALIAASSRTSAEPTAPQDHWTQPYNVVWTTPSQDAAGSMPLGNGEVGINLWVEEGGDLRFYISRSDSLSEISRLLKVGSVRVALSPNPFAGGPFKQELKLRDGVCEITAGQGAAKVTLHVFVDADHPVVHVTGESPTPHTITATADVWRTAPHKIDAGEKNSAWSLHGVSFDLTEAADVFPSAPTDAAIWYHRNETSTAFESTIKVQSLESVANQTHDPLIHRTFGGWLTGAGFKAVESHAIETAAPVNSFVLRVAAPCMQTPTAQAWLDAAQKIAADTADGQAAQRRTAEWWNAYWDRAWLITNAGRGATIPANNQPLRIGYDSNGQNKFPGQIARISIYGHALPAEQIGQLAAAGRDQPAPIKDGVVVSGDGSPRQIAAESLDFKNGLTVEAWIKADRSAPGRIVDKVTAGGADGFLFDTHPGNTLRLIVGGTTLTAPEGILHAGQWHHAAATINASTGGQCLYLDGKVVAEVPEELTSPITRAYTLQRYVQACGGRGTYPIKFNGGIFTVEPKAMGKPFNADFRSWGDCHWWQNVRHMYFPMPGGGDAEMMQPLFALYQAARPLSEARAKLYYNAEGCYFPETMTVWGTYANGDYSVNRNGKKPGDIGCGYWQFAWNQGLELTGLLLDRWDYTDDEVFLKQQVLPMAQSVLKYFDTRFKKDAAGKIILDPTQAVETYWHGVINDMPATAGLNSVTARLCILPERLTTSDQRTFFAHMQAAAPAVPIEEITVNGQVVRKLAPARKYNPGRSNCENPELYGVWPFRLYGLGKPDLDIARAAYAHRHNHLDVGWGYDGNCAAVLGLTDEAARILKVKCANSHAGYRWPATWGPNFDWLPDQNHGGNLLETAQLMVLQADGGKIMLLPAWPRHWDVDFKLHAPHQTTVEGRFHNGKLEELKVTPAQRRADVVDMTK